jgi:hypothetical protein
MTAEEYQEALLMIGTIVRIAQTVPVDEVLAMIDNSESIAPILDPTLYRTFLYNSRARADLDATKELARCIKNMQAIAAKLAKAHGAPKEQPT